MDQEPSIHDNGSEVGCLFSNVEDFCHFEQLLLKMSDSLFETPERGSEYRTCLVLKWSKRGWMPNGLVFECHLNTGQPDHLNTKQMDSILFSYVMVRNSNGQSST